MSADSQQLARYLDGEMTPVEAAAFEARLGGDRGLQRELAQLREVGAAMRSWSRGHEERAGDLLEPTLRRVRRRDEQRRSRHSLASYVVAGVALVALPWGRLHPDLGSQLSAAPAVVSGGAAIERVEATDRRAQVFVVGSSSTPVLWLADDVSEDGAVEQDPG